MTTVAAKGIRFPCPGCGEEVTVLTEPYEALTHPEPPCERFHEVNSLDDATDLMREARQKLAPESFD